MFIIRDLTLLYGEQILFNDTSCTIKANEKIGIVGRNGAGKSTLLKILTGHICPDEGQVHADKKRSVAYLPQELVLNSTNTVFDEAFAAFDTYVQLRAQATKLEHAFTNDSATDADIETYAQLQEQLSDYNHGQLERKTETVLYGLGFTTSKWSQPVNELSVGWQMRVLLARQLLQDADFYLFDEPTNHLDLPTKEWFLRYLNEQKAGYLLISHDRSFLDHACDKILEIANGDMTLYNGNFSSYVTQKEKYQQQREQAKKEQEKEIARRRATIERFKAKPSKAKMAKAMERQLEKMETIQLESALPTVSFRFPQIVRPGKVVLTVSNSSYAYTDTPLFTNASFELKRGQKAALIAANGVGKTTLFNVITGNLPVQTGDITVGHNVSYAYFEQDQIRALQPTNSIWEEVNASTRNIPETTIRTFLGSFLFSGDAIHKSISALSGGEKNRVAMVKALLQKANLMLLDEPTNHLDMYAKEVLLQAIQQYDGTVLYVSHDQEFIEKTADTILELTPTGIIEYAGDYTSYLQQRNIRDGKAAAEKEESTASQKSEHISDNHADMHKLRKQIHALERQMQKLEKQQKTLSNQIQRMNYGDPGYDAQLQKLKQNQQELTRCEDEWETLNEQTE